MGDATLIVRVMVEVETAAEAEEEMRTVASLVDAHGAVVGHRIKQYWKIPEFWDVAVDLHPPDPPSAAFDAVLALAPAGWTVGEPNDGVGRDEQHLWAVWDAAPGVTFLTPRVRWSEVSLWPPDDPDSEQDRA